MKSKTEINPRRKALRAMTYGLYLVSVKFNDTYLAAIVTWLSQVSFNPPLIMLTLERKGRICAPVKEKGLFAVNMPGQDQKKLALSFLKGCMVDGQKMNGFNFIESSSGSPYFENCAYYLECEVKQSVSLAEHELIIAEVLDATIGTGAEPLSLRDTGLKYGG